MMIDFHWHHGHCDSCKERHTLVCHFGYGALSKAMKEGMSVQEVVRQIPNYRVCEYCLFKAVGP